MKIITICNVLILLYNPSKKQIDCDQAHYLFIIKSRYDMTNTVDKFDLVVVGAGVFGLSTSVFIATHYPHIKFALLEQFKVGHGEGSSGSQIRIIRSTYQNPFYRDLCIEGIKKYWPEVEKLFNDKFIAANSCLYYDEDIESFKNFEQVAKTSNGQIEMLSLDKVKQLFPSAPSIEINMPVFHDTKAGVVFAEKYIKAMIAFIKSSKNVTLLEETTVVSIQNSEKQVILTAKTSDKVFQIRTKKVALSCGRWIGKLVPEIKDIAKQARQTVSFWHMKQPENYVIGKFPCWIHRNPKGIEYYGLPDVNGVGLKYGLHSQDSSLFNRFKSEAEYEKHMTQNYYETSSRYFKGRFEKLAKIEKCYYTVTKSEDFLIDWSDENENILVVSPCSGHGFKFGPVIGKVVADILIKDSSIPVFEDNRYYCRLFYHLGIDLK